SKLVPAGTRVELRVHRTPALTEEKKAAILADVRALDSVTDAEWTTARAQGASPPGAPPPWVLAMMAGGQAKPVAGAVPPKPPPVDEDPMLRLYAERGGDVAVKAAQIMVSAGLELADLHLAQPSLEDVFIHLTGKGLRD